MENIFTWRERCIGKRERGVGKREKERKEKYVKNSPKILVLCGICGGVRFRSLKL